MYTSNSRFNSLIQENGRKFKYILDFGNSTQITEFEDLRYSGGSNIGSELEIGSTISAYLTVTAITDLQIIPNEFQFLVGIYDSQTNDYTYIPMGYFIVQKPTIEGKKVKFEAYDRMSKFEKLYTSELTYPTTDVNIINEICTKVGVQLGTQFLETITISEKPEGYTCREVISMLASLRSKFACIDRTGKLNICWYTNSNYSIPTSRLWKFEKTEKDYKIERVELYKDAETTYSYGNGNIKLTQSNIFATQQIAQDIYNVLSQFDYDIANIQMVGDCRFDCWDIVSTTDLNDTTYNIPIMTLNHEFNGGLKTQIKSTGTTETQNESKFEGTVTKAIGRTFSEILATNKILANKIDATEVEASYLRTDLANIGTAQIGSANIQDGAITNAKIANGTIENAKIKDGTIENAKIKDGAITSAKIQDASITSAKIGTGAISTALIQDGAVTNEKVGNLNANKITTGTIDASKITVTNLNASNINVGTINGQLIGTGTVGLSSLDTEVTTKSDFDDTVENLQAQIDGNIETYTGTVVPTLANEPASSWSDEQKTNHIGDLYYVINAESEQDGFCYRFAYNGSAYTWELLKDSDVTKALEDIREVQDDIDDIKEFDSEMASFKTDTTEELSSLKERTTTLETDMGNKVETSTFNSLKQTVDTNTASITTLTTSKADSSTVTSLTNRVNTVEQTATTNSSSISEMQAVSSTDVSTKGIANIIDITSDRSVAKVNSIGGKSVKCSNLWDEQWEVGMWNENTGAKASSNLVMRNIEPIKVKPNTTYYMTVGVCLYFYDTNKTFISSDVTKNTSGTFVTPNNCYYLNIKSFTNYGNTYKNDIAIVEGTSGTYEPYYEGIHHAKTDYLQSVGKNIWDEQWELGSYSSTTGEKLNRSTMRSANYIHCKPSTKYYCDLGTYTSYSVVFFYDVNKNYISFNIVYGKNGISKNFGNPFTTPSNCKYITFYVAEAYGTTYKNDIAIIKGTSGTYSPYKTDKLDIPQGIQDLDGYGWGINDEVYNYVDFNLKKYSNMKSIDLTTLSWTLRASDKLFYAYCPIVKLYNSSEVANMVCSKYPVVSRNNLTDKTICSVNSYIMLYDSDYTDLDTFIKDMKLVSVYCEANPNINIWDEQWRTGWYSNGVYTAYTKCICSTNKIPVKPNTTYYIAGSSSSILFYWICYDANGNYIEKSDYDAQKRYYKAFNNTIKIPTDTYYITFYCSDDYGSVYKNDISIMEGWSGYYIPYGEKPEVVDYNANLYHKKIGRVKLKDLTFTRSKYRNDYYFVSPLPLSKVGSTSTLPCVCNKYSTTTQTTGAMNDKECAIYGYSSTYSGVFIRDDSYTDTTVFKNHFTDDDYIYYELATEQVIDITGKVGADTIGIEKGGTIELHNEYSLDVPYDMTLLATNNALNYYSSLITQNKDGISTKVQKNEVISEINQSAEEIKISADRIKLSGDTEVDGSFFAQEITASNMNITGGSVDIKADSTKGILLEQGRLGVTVDSNTGRISFMSASSMASAKTETKIEGGNLISTYEGDTEPVELSHGQFSFGGTFSAGVIDGGFSTNRLNVSDDVIAMKTSYFNSIQANSIKVLNNNLGDIVGIFSDTSASDIKDLLRKKIALIPSNNGMYLINGGYQGTMYGFTLGSNIDGVKQVVFYSYDGIYYCKLENGNYTYSKTSMTAF